MVGYWVSFGLIALFILFGLPFGLNYGKRFVKGEITPEMEKGAKSTLSKAMFLYLLADFFYMSHFIDNLVCKFIFGGLMLLLIYSNLGYGFSSPTKKNGFARFGLIQDFVIGVALTVYLIYLIPDKDLQSVIIPTVAAVYGGLITLTGVAWTIRWSEKNRENDELKDLRPLVFISSPKTINGDIKPCTTCISDSLNKGDLLVCDKGDGAIHFKEFQLANSDNSYCTFRGILINNEKYHWFDHGKVLDKREHVIISLANYFEFKGEINEICLILEDMRDNVYLLQVEFKVGDFDPEGTKSILLTGAFRPEHVEFNFGDEILSK